MVGLFGSKPILSHTLHLQYRLFRPRDILGSHTKSQANRDEGSGKAGARVRTDRFTHHFKSIAQLGPNPEQQPCCCRVHGCKWLKDQLTI